MSTKTARTRRSFDRMFASPGAVNQRGGKLPIYVCNTCENEVVWVESSRTGRKYLVNTLRGYHGQRFYIGANVHKCEQIMAERTSRTAEAEAERTRRQADDDQAQADRAAAIDGLFELLDKTTDPAERENIANWIRNLTKAAQAAREATA